MLFIDDNVNQVNTRYVCTRNFRNIHACAVQFTVHAYNYVLYSGVKNSTEVDVRQ